MEKKLLNFRYKSNYHIYRKNQQIFIIKNSKEISINEDNNQLNVYFKKKIYFSNSPKRIAGFIIFAGKDGYTLNICYQKTFVTSQFIHSFQQNHTKEKGNKYMYKCKQSSSRYAYRISITALDSVPPGIHCTEAPLSIIRDPLPYGNPSFFPPSFPH